MQVLVTYVGGKYDRMPWCGDCLEQFGPPTDETLTDWVREADKYGEHLIEQARVESKYGKTVARYFNPAAPRATELPATSLNVGDWNVATTDPCGGHSEVQFTGTAWRYKTVAPSGAEMILGCDAEAGLRLFRLAAWRAEANPALQPAPYLPPTIRRPKGYLPGLGPDVQGMLFGDLDALPSAKLKRLVARATADAVYDREAAREAAQLIGAAEDRRRPR